MTKSRSQQIFEHALKFATPFSTTLGHAWAIIPDGPMRYHGWPVASKRFREWLAHGFHHEHGLFPGCHALDAAVRTFSAHAHHSEFPVSDVFTRIGYSGDRLNPQSVLLHLANADNELVEITPGGRHLVSGKSWRFLAARSTYALPRPIDSTAPVVHQLQSLLGIDGPALHRAAVWLFAALRPTGPYPVLVITGAPASGKSTLARTLRTLIDPSATPLLSPPSSERDLWNLALHNRVLAFDDVTRLPHKIAASIARLATGTGLAISNRNIFDDPEPLALERPIIITSRNAHPACLTSNTMHVDLMSPKLESLRTQASLSQQLEASAPSILGALCEAVSSALANISSTKVAAVSRFPDVHHWTTAAAPLLGLTTEQINRALAANPLIDAIHELLEPEPEWTGTATQLAEILNYSSSPNHLSEQLASLPLALFGLTITSWMSHRTRLIRLTTTTSVIVSKAAA